jgi:diaminopimelate epimerase
MQAQGNDFVILNALVDELPELTEPLIKQICDRHLGIGCDQLLLLTSHPDADALMLIYNADASQAANCGNGLRCAADLLMKNLNKSDVYIALADRLVEASRTLNGVKVNMGKVMIEAITSTYTDINIGNAHRVYFSNHQPCPERNVEIIETYNEIESSIHIIEKGVGETMACGSGACAAAQAIWQKTSTDNTLSIHMLGGTVSVSQVADDVYLEGDTFFVFHGLYHNEA